MAELPRTEIFAPLSLESFLLEPFVVAALSSALLSSALFATLALRSRFQVIQRPAFLLSAGAHVIHQWPLALFAPVFARNLDDPWFFLVAVNAPVLFGLAISMIGGKPAGRPGVDDAAPDDGRSGMIDLAPALVLTALITIAYFAIVDWRYTALFALLFDPELSLLAREFSGKLLPGSTAFYVHGALSNVLVPVLSMLAVRSIVRGVGHRSALSLSAGLGLLFVSVPLALLPGAKGGLVPAFIACVVCFVVMDGGLVRRTASVAVACVVCFVVLDGGLVRRTASVAVACVVTLGPFVMFDTVRENGVFRSLGLTYDFARCAQRYGVCDASRTLVESSLSRSESIGVSDARTRRLLAELDVFCPTTVPASPVPVPPVPVPPVPVPPVPVAGAETGRPAIGTPGMGANLASLVAEANRVAYGLAYRAFVTPVQASSWYFRHAEDHGRIGPSGLGFLRRFSVDPVNVPSLIHEIYYPVFSGGANVSTGTVPVAFFVAYPAVIGWWGVALALGLILGLDLLVRALQGRLPHRTRALSAGLMAAMAVNCLSSEFGTVLLSHGGWLALSLTALWTLAGRGGAGPRRGTVLRQA